MEISPIIVSMKTASVSIVITFFLGLAAAYGVERIRSRKLQLICDGILTLPLVLPPTVAGFFLLYIFGVKRPVGRFFLEFFGTKIAFSWQATVLAAVAISFPLMYRSARGALQQVDENLLYAGRTLGMSEWCIFWKVWFPNAMSGILCICKRIRRVWSNRYDRRKYCRRDQNASACSLFRGVSRKYGRSVSVCVDSGDHFIPGSDRNECSHARISEI